MIASSRLMRLLRRTAGRSSRLRSRADWLLAAARVQSNAALRARLEWIVPVDQPMLLISQIQRSGGTFLSRLFDDHPECFAHPYELHWGRPTKEHWPQLDMARSAAALFDTLDERWIGKALRAHCYSKGKRVVDTHPFVFSRSLQRRIFARLLRSTPPTSQRAVLDVSLTAFFNSWLDYQSLYSRRKRVVTAFTPRVCMQPSSLDRFWNDYPDGHLVSIVRDPASWLASAKRYGPQYADAGTAIELWKASLEHTLAARARWGDRVTILIFRDLVNDTEAAMRHVCASVGLTFTPTLVEPTYNGRPVASNSSFVSRSGVDSMASDRSAWLDREELARVRDQAEPLYESLSSRFSLDSLQAAAPSGNGPR